MGPQTAAGQMEAQQLQELRSRTERAERRLLACENLVGELGSNLAALGSLLQDYGHLQQRLDNVENLLKNRNFWILRLPPSSRGEIPKVPLTFDDISVYFNEQEWERLERWQRDLYRAVMRGNYETLISLDYAVSKPDILSKMERDEELCIEDGLKHPQTHIGHHQEPSEPRTRGDQELLQAPEAMDQAEEALGKDKVPLEADTERAVSRPGVPSCIQRSAELCVRDRPQTRSSSSQKPPQTNIPDSRKPSQTSSPRGQKHPQTAITDGQKPPQMSLTDSQNPPQTDVPRAQKPPHGQNAPQTEVPRAQKPPHGQSAPQTEVPRAQKPPALSSRRSPETGVTAQEKAPQTLEETDSGADEVPTEGDKEAPIMMMNIVSLRTPKEKLCGEDQSEMEMEEDSAEPDSEEDTLMEGETAHKGASANVKVKKEEPEELQEVSAASPSSEIQKYPRNEQAKAKSKKKLSRCESSSLLMGNCRRGYVREWSHPCTECGKRFRLKINLIIHQRSHAKEGPYECSMCEISFNSKHHLDLHQGIHIKDRAFGAKVWGNVHPELRIRPRRKFCENLHGGRSHCPGYGHTGGALPDQTKEEPPDRGSPSSGYLSKQHISKSPRKPSLKCNHCKKILSCPHSLQRHLRTHIHERPYCCNTCKKCFTRRNHLERHEKIHERQKALDAALQQPSMAQSNTTTPASHQPPPQATSAAPPKRMSPAAATAQSALANVLLMGSSELGATVKNCHSWASRATQPVVRLGSRATVVEK
ncbi:zinc finger protein 282-like isoform X2 [Pogoniulus pusillus]